MDGGRVIDGGVVGGGLDDGVVEAVVGIGTVVDTVGTRSAI